MEFSPAQLLHILTDLPAARRYWVAYSGGVDSHVLLYALAACRSALGSSQLQAVHIHHGLHPDADQWTGHCRAVCAALKIPLEVIRVDARAARGQSPEAAAREARYRALAGIVEAHDCLLTAHHRDDQAETLLLQLLRGSGPHGLAAMPREASFGRGRHVRPLLGFDRAGLLGYAQRHGLGWVDDGSNVQLDYDRNFLRHEVLPRLKARWPAASLTISRSASHCADAARLMDGLAQMDLQVVRTRQPDRLPIGALQTLDEERRRNVLRCWIRGLGLPLPSSTHLQHILTDVLGSAWDATPCVRWPGTEVRRHRGMLYAMHPLAVCDRRLVLRWNVCEPLAIPQLHGQLIARPAQGRGLKVAACDGATVSVRLRQGGERCRPAGRTEHHALKKLFQEQGIPPWQRERIPLIYLDDRLAAVAGLWVCAPFQAQNGEAGLVIEWQSD